MNNKVLLIDDETHVLETSRLTLMTAGISDVITCSDSREALGIIKENDISVVVSDIMMPHLSGKELLPQITELKPNLPVIMMTALGDLENVVECMKLGAFDYLDKPVEGLRLVTSIKRALDYSEVKDENLNLKKCLLSGELRHPEVFSEILTESPKMNQIFSYIESISISSRAVLITGETGTGKELVAECVHKLSGRQGEYVTVNVAGLDDTLFSDALFGHKKGAFTGADSHREGLLEKAQGGTIFLDEIGDLSMSSQIKLLRLIQEREYYPLGSDQKKRTDARFVVATSRNIRDMIKDDSFRKDLYYRLQAHQIHIPPLAERMEDLPVLLEFFISNSSKDLGIEMPILDEDVLKNLMQYDFPGNIRELEALVFNAVSQNKDGEIKWESFKRDIELTSGRKIEEQLQKEPSQDTEISSIEDIPTIDDYVDRLIERALNLHGHNQTATAKSLGITRQGLLSRMKRRKA